MLLSSLDSFYTSSTRRSRLSLHEFYPFIAQIQRRSDKCDALPEAGPKAQNVPIRNSRCDERSRASHSQVDMESLPREVSEQLSLRCASSDKSDPQKGYSQHSHRPTASRRACGSAHSRATSGRMLAAMARPASADVPSNGLSSKSQTLTLQKSDFRKLSATGEVA